MTDAATSFSLLREELCLTDYVNDLQNGKPFSLSRWGDGEWRAVLRGRSQRTLFADDGSKQRQTDNCDKHRFFPDMNEQLANILRARPPYRLGLQGLAMRLYGKQITKFCRRHCPSLRWHNSTLLSAAVTKGTLGPFLEGMSRYPLILVGPEYLRPAMGWFQRNPCWHVSVPLLDCFLALEEIEQHIHKIARMISGIFVVSITASMPAGILVDNLYKIYGERAFLFDAGSVYDPLVGQKTRSSYQEGDFSANLTWLNPSGDANGCE